MLLLPSPTSPVRVLDFFMPSGERGRGREREKEREKGREKGRGREREREGERADGLRALEVSRRQSVVVVSLGELPNDGRAPAASSKLAVEREGEGERKRRERERERERGRREERRE